MQIPRTVQPQVTQILRPIPSHNHPIVPSGSTGCASKRLYLGARCPVPSSELYITPMWSKLWPKRRNVCCVVRDLDENTREEPYQASFQVYPKIRNWIPKFGRT